MYKLFSLHTHKVLCSLRGGIKKKLVFFRKTPKGGGRGLAKSEISLSEKTEIFLEKGWGGLTYSKRVLSQKTGDFGLFLPKRGVI